MKQQAHETGYHSTYLKEIEKGLVIPSVSAIFQIAKALSVESGTFLVAEQQRASEERGRKSFFVRTEGLCLSNLYFVVETNHLKTFLVTVDPRKGHMGIHYHHEGKEFISVLEGNVTMKVGEERNALATGQSLHVNSAISHKLSNCCDKPVRFIAVISTPYERPQGSQPAARGVYSVLSKIIS